MQGQEANDIWSKLLAAVLVVTAVQNTGGESQKQETIGGDLGMSIVVNITSNFGVQVYRNLEQSMTTQVPMTSPITGTPATTSMVAQTTAPSTGSGNTGNINFTIVGLTETDNTSKPITEQGFSVSRDELMTRGYFRQSSYLASLNSDNSTQASCNQFIVNSVGGVSPKGAINVTLCSIKTSGTIVKSSAGVDSGVAVVESIQVKVGQVWMSVSVSSWTWCNSCQKDGDTAISGKYLNVELEVSVHKSRKITTSEAVQGKPIKYGLGADAEMDLSKMAKVDVVTQQIPAGFPTLIMSGGEWKGIVTVPLPRFTSSASFWQIIDPGYQPAPKDGTDVVGGASKMSTVSSLLISMSAMLGVLRALSLVGLQA